MACSVRDLWVTEGVKRREPKSSDLPPAPNAPNVEPFVDWPIRTSPGLFTFFITHTHLLPTLCSQSWFPLLPLLKLRNENFSPAVMFASNERWGPSIQLSHSDSLHGSTEAKDLQMEVVIEGLCFDRTHNSAMRLSSHGSCRQGLKLITILLCLHVPFSPGQMRSKRESSGQKESQLSEPESIGVLRGRCASIMFGMHRSRLGLHPLAGSR